MAKILPIESVSFADFGTPTFEDPNKPSRHNAAIATEVKKLDRSEAALFAGEYACFATVEAPDVEFTLLPEFKTGRGASRQGVYFGDLSVESELQMPISTFVAVKPYDKRKVNFRMRPEMALVHDWATNVHLDGLSSGSTYRPVGVWRNHDTFFVPQLLTRYNERSKSLDNYFQPRHRDVEVEQEQSEVPFGLVLPLNALANERDKTRLRHAIELGHFGLGFAHGAGITHGDAFPQNFAIDGTRILFNDVTTLRPYGPNMEKNEKLVAEDVSDFWTGAFHPDVSTETGRKYILELLHDEDVAGLVFASYMKGMYLSQKRLVKDGRSLINQKQITDIIKSVADAYATSKASND